MTGRRPRACPSDIPRITRRNFHAAVLNATLPVVVGFHTSAGKDLSILALLLDGLARACHVQVKVVRVNVATDPRIAHCYGVAATPSLALFRHGRVVATLFGLPEPEALKTWFENAVGLSEAIAAIDAECPS